MQTGRALLTTFGTVFLAATLSACEVAKDMYAGLHPVPAVECEERTVRQLEGISFTNAALVDVVVRDGEFTPMIVRLTKGHPYILRIRNRDEEVRVFNAPELFDNIAVAAIAMDNDIQDTICPGPAVEMLPGQSFEMQFYAATDGVYGYRDSSTTAFTVGNLFSPAPPGGIIRIEEPY